MLQTTSTIAEFSEFLWLHDFEPTTMNVSPQRPNLDSRATSVMSNFFKWSDQRMCILCDVCGVSSVFTLRTVKKADSILKPYLSEQKKFFLKF